MVDSRLKTIKGNCSECGHYNDCPRMKGINYCFSSSKHKQIAVKNKILKTGLIIIGFISLFLGIIGIFIPLLPTTPFILLTALCFVKSSDKLYLKLVSNRLFGKIINAYNENSKMLLKYKIITLIFMLIILSLSILYVSKFKI